MSSRGNERVLSKGSEKSRDKLPYLSCLVLLLVILAIIGVNAADADSSESGSPPHITPANIEEGVREGSSPEYHADLTDPEAAEELPHSDLDREQALELMQSVFDPLLEAPAGIFDELHVERFLSDTAAILPAGEQLESPGPTIGMPPSDRYEGPTLIESTIPLRTEGNDSSVEVLDLGLEREAGELHPQVPLVEVGIPDDLSEGISLPETGIQIKLEGAPEGRAPSTVDQSVAAFPEVATDTSLAVSPTPTGLETMTVLQSPEAPTSQTFHLDLPQGAELKPTEAGGAEVVKGGQPILGVAPPSALDAAEREVPVSLRVSGSSLTLHATPDAETSWPAAIDPLYETYNWWNGITGLGGWGGWTNAAPTYYRDSHDHCDPFASPYSCQTGETSNAPGLFIGALPGPVAAGATANWEFIVPRWFEEWELSQKAPESWIASMYLGNIGFWQRSDWAVDPTLWMGLWNTESGGWVPGLSASGNYPGYNGNFGKEFLSEGNMHAKLASFSLVDPSGYDLTAFRDAFVNTAVVSIADTGAPNLNAISGPKNWVNQVPTEPISVTARDAGLGVYRLRVSAENVPQSSNWPVQTMPCAGTTVNPCKGVSTFTLTKHTGGNGEVRDYDPSVMPQGADNVFVTAEDPLGNKSSTNAVKVWVDHTPPTLSISGTATEQAASGANLSQYSLKYSAADGDSAAAAALAPFGTAGTGPGQIQDVRGIATDASGNVYLIDRLNKRVMKYDSNGKFLMQFGTPGTGNGQFSDPRGIAVSSNGTIWVTDMGNNNVQAFNSNGQFLRKISEAPGTNASFADPYGVAPGPGGVLWVSDVTSEELFEFNESGTFIRLASGSPKGSNKPAEMTTPSGLATDAAGNVWLSDWSSNRVQEYNSSGEFVMQFSSVPGTSSGHLETPIDIDVAPSGNLLVTEEQNNRVDVFQPTGTFLRSFGSAGAGNAGFSAPKAIAVGPGNKAYVSDFGNHRVAVWSHADLNRQSGVAATEVKVDGQLVEPKYQPGCATETCSISREWTLKANAYSSGQHKVKVTATDGVGLSTSKEFTITTDSTPPQLATSGEFFSTPDGWLEQKGYPASATASDPAGSGVRSITFKLDGEALNTEEQSCPSGACGMTMAGTVPVEFFKGGAHVVELIATDVAGNVTKKAWTINVDPKGEISAAEAIDTLEASDETAETTVVSPNSEVIGQEEREDGNDPSLEEAPGGGLIVKGAPTETEIPEDPSEPITIPTPEGELQIEPIGASGEDEPAVANESAVVTPNTSEQVDTVVRPVFDGILSFAIIRNSEAPEEYSWRVLMGKGQTLVQIDEQDAEVRNANGTSAAGIQAQPAHDATGKELETSLKVEGTDVVTLTVHHKVVGVVYPVVGGPGFEVGYETVSAYIPPPPEEKVPLPGNPSPGDPGYVPDPEPEPAPSTGGFRVEAPEVSASGGKQINKAEMWDCQTHVCEVGAWRVTLKNSFFFNGHEHVVGGAAWHSSSNYINCDDYRSIWPWSIDVNHCEWIGPDTAPYGHGEHLCVQERYHINRP